MEYDSSRSIDMIDSAGHEWTKAYRYRDACNEIVRLRAEIGEAERRWRQDAEDAIALRAEVERLKGTNCHLRDLVVDLERRLNIGVWP